MNDEIKNAIVSLKKVKTILSNISTRAEAVKYLVNQTGLSGKECGDAYDILIKLDLENAKLKIG